MKSSVGNGSGWRLISAAEARPRWTGRERRVMGHVVLMAKYPCVLVSTPGAEEPLASEKLDGDIKSETHRRAAGGGETEGWGCVKCRLQCAVGRDGRAASLAGIGTMTWARWCASKHHYPDAHAAGHGGSRRTPSASQQCVEALAPRGVRLPHEVLPQGGLRAPAVRAGAALPRCEAWGGPLGQSPPALTGVETAAKKKA